ncbi:MAG: hypothetical protein WCJ80_00580 [Bacteroidota bacterium]
MSLEKIQLPDFVIANLYTDLLVLGTDVQTIQTNTEAITLTELKTEAPVVNTTSEKAVPKPKTIAIPQSKEPVVLDSDKQWYLGNNGKHIVVIIKETGVAFINDKHLQFLSNILNACKLNLGDIALINHSNNPNSYTELKQKLQPKFVLVFDLETKEIKLPFTMPNYQVQSHDNCKFLFASSLTKMDGDSQEAKMEKSKLWMSLKNMFQL